MVKFSLQFFNFLRILATKISIDSSARLIHRETGKIILPYEHFANAVFLKHCSSSNGPNHLNLESTIKAVFDSYSCGKDAFGFDRDFIIEVLNSCPTCRFSSYKGGQQQAPPQVPHQNFPPPNINMDYLGPNRSPALIPMQPPIDPTKMNRPLTNQQITQQIFQQQQQQQNRMSQSMENLEKQRIMHHLDKKNYETVQAIVQANNNLGIPSQMNQMNTPSVSIMPPIHNHNMNHSKSVDFSR